jgi:hypothetical protein
MSDQSKVKMSSQLMAQAPDILRGLAMDYANSIEDEDWAKLEEELL